MGLFRRRGEGRLEAPTIREAEEQRDADHLEQRAKEIDAYTTEELRHLAALAIAKGEGERFVDWQTRDYMKAAALANLAVVKTVAEGQPRPGAPEAS